MDRGHIDIRHCTEVTLSRGWAVRCGAANADASCTARAHDTSYNGSSPICLARPIANTDRGWRSQLKGSTTDHGRGSRLPLLTRPKGCPFSFQRTPFPIRRLHRLLSVLALAFGSAGRAQQVHLRSGALIGRSHRLGPQNRGPRRPARPAVPLPNRQLITPVITFLLHPPSSASASTLYHGRLKSKQR